MSIAYIESKIQKYEALGERQLVEFWQAVLRFAKIEIPKEVE